MKGSPERTKLQVSSAEFAGVFLSEETLRNILNDCLENGMDVYASLKRHVEVYEDAMQQVGKASYKHDDDMELDNIKIWLVAMPIIFGSVFIAYVQSRSEWLGLSAFSYLIAKHLYQFFGTSADEKQKAKLSCLQFDPNELRKEVANYIKKQESTLNLFTDKKDRILK